MGIPNENTIQIGLMIALFKNQIDCIISCQYPFENSPQLQYAVPFRGSHFTALFLDMSLVLKRYFGRLGRAS